MTQERVGQLKSLQRQEIQLVVTYHRTLGHTTVYITICLN